MKQISIVELPYANTTIKYNKLVANPYDKDIVPGVYEGGCKVWECTLDFLKFMAEGKIDFTGKKVMDIGCGHGLLGIAALKSGAACCYFQDYNKEVINDVTMTNILLNDFSMDLCKFLYGDWDNLDEK